LPFALCQLLFDYCLFSFDATKVWFPLSPGSRIPNFGMNHFHLIQWHRKMKKEKITSDRVERWQHPVDFAIGNPAGYEVQ